MYFSIFSAELRSMYRRFLIERKPAADMSHKRLEKVYQKLILAHKPFGLYKQMEVKTILIF